MDNDSESRFFVSAEKFIKPARLISHFQKVTSCETAFVAWAVMELLQCLKVVDQVIDLASFNRKLCNLHLINLSLISPDPGILF